MNKIMFTIAISSMMAIVLFSGCNDMNSSDQITLSIKNFTVEPSNITKGESASLGWHVIGVQTVYIDNGIGNVSSEGQQVITPNETTTYTLTVQNGTNIITSTAFIRVMDVINNSDGTPDDGNQSNDTGSDNDYEYSGDNPLAIINTSRGIIKIELYEDKAPKTVQNFRKLVSEGFYDRMIFHLVIDDYKIQTGTTYYYGQTVTFNRTIEFETDPDLVHTDGAVSMASDGWGEGGSSEFFICDGPQGDMDGKYAVFGQTIEGMDVVREIADEVTDDSNPLGGGKPLNMIIIYSITIQE